MTEEIQAIQQDLKNLLITKSKDELDIKINISDNNLYSILIDSKNDGKCEVIGIKRNDISYFNKIKYIFFDNVIFSIKNEELYFMLYSLVVGKEYNGILEQSKNASAIQIGFEDCIFGNIRISFLGLKFNSLLFKNCLFDNEIYFSSCSFEILSFSNCIGLKKIRLSNVTLRSFPFLSQMDKELEMILFQSTFKLSICLDDFSEIAIKKISFVMMDFNHGFAFSDNKKLNIFQTYLQMYEVSFSQQIEFDNIKFKNGFYLKKIAFKDRVIFTDRFIKNNYENAVFFNELIFYKNFNFKNFFNSYIQEIEINNCNFKDKFEFPKQEGYKQKIKIIDTTFDDRVDFIERSFGNDLMIKNCVFNKDLSFKQSKFIKRFDFIENKVKDNIDFSDVSFEISPNFQSSVFEKLVILYKTKFKEIPNFYSASFSSSAVLDMPLVDIKDYSFNHLKDEIKSKSSLIDIKGIRECLNIFKNALLKTSNILEASKYKVLELYAKELELDYKLEHKKELEEKITIKEQFDRWFLKLNRTTSDHHTDFLKILLFTLSVIGGYFMINFGLSFDEKIISSIYSFVDLGLAMYGISIVIFLLCLGYEFLFVLKGFSKDKGWLIFIFLAICVAWFCLAYSFSVSEFSVILPMIFIGILAMLFILLANNVKYTFISFAAAGFIGILCNPSIITPFLGAFSEDARNHYLYKAIDELDSQKALDLSRQILAKEPTSELNAKKILKDYKDELKSSDLLDKAPELKRAVAIDGGVSRLNIAYYLVLAFCIFALQKTMRKNSIIPS